MPICKLVVNDGKEFYVICHRVKYKLFGESQNREIDIATNLDRDISKEHRLVTKEVVKTAEESIFTMNQEYIEEEIPENVDPFIIYRYTLISDTGEIL